jgi:hypothetical protein
VIEFDFSEFARDGRRFQFGRHWCGSGAKELLP